MSETINTIPIDPLRIPPLPLPPPPPPPPPPSQQSDNTLPILAISLLGILTAALLFLFYYIFVIKCWLRHRGTYRSENEPTTDYSAEIGNRGLEESAIRAIPTFRFGNGIGGGGGGSGGGKGSFHECAVCLNEFQEEERIRLLPNCFHIFHIDCVDTWLKTNANCPLCRSHITTTSSIAAARLMEQAIHQNLQQREEAAIDVGDGDRSMRMNGRKPHHVSSMGDECIDVGLRDEQFGTQPTRRSFSMDLSSSRQVSLAVQEILRQNPHFKEVGNGENDGSGRSERSRRHLFSFRHCQSCRSSVLPIQFDP